ncbi:MAG TPA: YbhB/YbcL family Raf kinase inhibitor-like protein [Polyangiaceae bacterium]|nr:YbhB/YbcL family Raf kinase inhibitor-like protein [Polyangiaceae bacterium]
MTQRRKEGWIVGVTVFVALGAIQSRSMATSARQSSEGSTTTSSLKITSPAFAAMGAIPKKYTCEGTEASPPLEWTGAPAGTKSYALIEDDPDAPDPAAPKRVWVHWVLYSIPASVTRLAEGASSSLPKGVKTGTNDFGKAGYGGPCPPKGRHRYFHKIYALDTVLDLAGSPKKADVEAAMKGHVLAKAELVGTYQKGQ